MFKKLIFPAIAIAAGSLMVVGCAASSETDEPTTGAEMRFTAGEASRSSLVTNDNLKSFAVYGNMISTSTPGTRTTVFDNTPVTLADGAWTYEDTQYWFPGQTYSFAAVHFPTTDNISNLTYSDDKLTFRYTAPADYTKTDDILTAAHRRIYQAPATPVALSFGHIMARINFVASVDPSIPNVDITIHKIVISGVATRANYTLQAAPIAANSKQTSDLAGPAWTISSTPTRISITKEPMLALHSGESASLFDATVDPLLVIPQTVTSDLEVELTYSRTGGNTTTVRGRLRTPASAHGYQWAAGRAYTYNFSLGVDDFLIFSAPEIKGWDEDEGGTYIVVG